MEKLLAAPGLSDIQLQEIRDLEKACCSCEPLNMKLNWDTLETRSKDEINDFLYYVDGKLVGFLGLYGFGPKPKEFEMTAMVHPDYRHRGIGRMLLRPGIDKCWERGAERILMITEPGSISGVSFVKSTSSEYSFSEYRMKFDRDEIPSQPMHGITLHKAEPADHPVLKQIDHICFGLPEDENDKSYFDDKNKTTYIAKLDGQTVGKIGTLFENGGGYIFGVAIKPEYRGRGYGREILVLALTSLASKQIRPVFLEVAVDNINALSLYTSCGFEEVTVYDYYELKP